MPRTADDSSIGPVSTKPTGVVIGRFMPPHAGHEYLIRFARAYAGHVTVFVCTLHHEPIPGELRYRWMRELFPDATVVHVTEEIPEAARNHDGAYRIWARAIRERVDREPGYVFASEEFGLELARELGCRFVPVDPRREAFPVSAAMIRDDPYANWKFLPRCVRPYYARKVVATGGLADELAERYDTVVASDYFAHHARLGLPPPATAGLAQVARGQLAIEAALLPEANRLLICDVDVLERVTAESRRAAVARDETLSILGPLRDDFSHIVPAIVCSKTAPDPEYVSACAAAGWPTPVHTPTADDAAAAIASQLGLSPTD